MDLPSGTVTFLFSDIEGSTQLWQKFPDAMPHALSQHHALLREAIQARGGYVFQIIGDAFCAAFAVAANALDATVDAQRAFQNHAWGETGAIRVRMALHTGPVQVRVGDYTSGEYVSGLTLSRVARLLSAGHGGQILLSAPSYELVRDHLPNGITLRDLGARRLKDLIRPEHIFQVIVADLPTDTRPLKTLDARPNNLPVQLTSFIGREREMSEVKQRVMAQGTHLVTLLGPGGTGKTRLALQVGADLIDEFDYGVWFVDLAPLRDGALVAQSVAEVFNLRAQPERTLVETLTDYFETKALLLIFDNCEHVIDTSAQLAETLLHHAPKLKILASSRQALNVLGEVTYLVPPLALPDAKQISSPTALSQYEAVRLFIDRAVAVQPNFQVTNQNAPALAEICVRLDGIPLALELAAARVRVFSVEQIAQRLDDRFRLLTGGSRTALPRQQTLQAAIDWSYSLLTESERVLFRRCAVFAGGCKFEAVEAVTGEDAYAFENLPRLVDKSLVVADEIDGTMRYRMLETIREYAGEKLSAANETLTLQNAHLAYFVALAEEYNPQLGDGRQIEASAYLMRELDNFRAALEFSIQAAPAGALRLVNKLRFFWLRHSYFAEGHQWIERALTATAGLDAPEMERASGLNAAAIYEYVLGDYAAAERNAQAALDLAERIGDTLNLANAHLHLGLVASIQNEFTRAALCYEKAIEIARQTNDSRTMSMALGCYGIDARVNQDFERAQTYLDAALQLDRERGDFWAIAYRLDDQTALHQARNEYQAAIATCRESIVLFRKMQDKFALGGALTLLGVLSVKQDDFENARAALDEALLLVRDLGAKEALINVLEGFSFYYQACSDTVRAARLLSAAEHARERFNLPYTPLDAENHAQDKQALEKELSAELYAGEWAVGRAMTLEQAMALAMKDEGA